MNTTTVQTVLQSCSIAAPVVIGRLCRNKGDGNLSLSRVLAPRGRYASSRSAESEDRAVSLLGRSNRNISYRCIFLFRCWNVVRQSVTLLGACQHYIRIGADPSNIAYCFLSISMHHRCRTGHDLPRRRSQATRKGVNQITP